MYKCILFEINWYCYFSCGCHIMYLAYIDLLFCLTRVRNMENLLSTSIFIQYFNKLKNN